MSTAVQQQPDVAALSASFAGDADPAPIAALRARAAAEAAAKPLPATSERPWKYTDVSDLDLAAYRPARGAVTVESPAGVVATGLGDASPSLVERIGSAVAFGANRLSAYHYAFLSDGIAVDVPANAEPTAPVVISRAFAESGTLSAPHTIIVTGANARVTVIEDCSSGPGDAVVLPAVEIFPGPGAHVRYLAMHRWGPGTRVFGEQHTLPGRDATIVSFSLALGGRVLKSHIESTLAERGSSSELYGLCYGEGDQHADFYTLQDHVGPDTRSDLMFKAALRGHSRSVYYGLTRVGIGARNADANQENRNLLLSKNARADSDPVLEILTSNVIRASHGATAGPVDEEQLFYLEARGIARGDAEDLLVRGFLQQVIERFGDAAASERIAAALEEKLGAAH